MLTIGRGKRAHALDKLDIVPDHEIIERQIDATREIESELLHELAIRSARTSQTRDCLSSKPREFISGRIGVRGGGPKCAE